MNTADLKPSSAFPDATARDRNRQRSRPVQLAAATVSSQSVRRYPLRPATADGTLPFPALTAAGTRRPKRRLYPKIASIAGLSLIVAALLA